MFTKLGRTFAIFLLLSIFSAEYAIPAPSDDPCKGKKSDRPAECGDEETPGGEHSSLLVTLGDYGSVGQDIYGDGSAEYSDSEKTVTAALGGQTQPNKPGINVSLKKAGRNPRVITTEFECTSFLSGQYAGNCDLLTPPVTVTDDEMSMGVRPYEWNCPEELLNGECPDVFTMGTGIEYMSFRVNYWNHNILIEFASDIGGGGSPSPGRCLSLLDETQRVAFLTSCLNPGDCNVSVTANDDGDVSDAGAGDGENDEWVVSADNTLGLICSLRQGEEKVYGMTEMTFDFHAIKE